MIYSKNSPAYHHTHTPDEPYKKIQVIRITRDLGISSMKTSQKIGLSKHGWRSGSLTHTKILYAPAQPGRDGDGCE